MLRLRQPNRRRGILQKHIHMNQNEDFEAIQEDFEDVMEAFEESEECF